MNGKEAIVAIGKVAEQQFGLTVGENPHFGGVNPVHVENSNHYAGLAIDVTGPAKQLAAFDRWLANNLGDQLSELFYDPGISLKHGQRIGSIGGHGTHVHVATEPDGLKTDGKGGLDVGGILLDSLRSAANGIAPGSADVIGGALGFGKDSVGGFIGNQAAGIAGDVATAVIEGLASLIGEQAAKIALYIALVGGGVGLVLYGTSKAAGISESETKLLGPNGEATKLAMSVATKGRAK